jgi:hypothetical protein
MTAENETTQAATSESNRPTHIVRKKMGRGKNADFETLGAAWDRGDGSLYIKLHGTQIVEGGFYVFPAKDSSGKDESGQ